MTDGSALAVVSRNALYKSTFYLLTYLLSTLKLKSASVVAMTVASMVAMKVASIVATKVRTTHTHGPRSSVDRQREAGAS